jgi:hypothetical protein
VDISFWDILCIYKDRDKTFFVFICSNKILNTIQIILWYLNLKVRDEGILLKHTSFWTLAMSQFRLKTRRFGDWSPEIATSSIDWAQQSRFYLRTETDSSLRNVVFLIEIGKMDNVEKEVYFNYGTFSSYFYPK